MRVELAKTLYSELGNGSPSHAHIRHLERFARSTGVTQANLKATQPVPEVQQYLDLLQHLFVEAGHLQALGAELAVENNRRIRISILYTWLTEISPVYFAGPDFLFDAP